MLMWNISWFWGEMSCSSLLSQSVCCLYLLPANHTNPVFHYHSHLTFVEPVVGMTYEHIQILQKYHRKYQEDFHEVKIKIAFCGCILACSLLDSWSTSSPFHPEKARPCNEGHVDQPPATLVKFGSSKVKVPFFFFSLKHLLGVPSAQIPRVEFRRTCWFQALLWLVQSLKADQLSLKRVSSSVQWYLLL